MYISIQLDKRIIEEKSWLEQSKQHEYETQLTYNVDPKLLANRNINPKKVTYITCSTNGGNQI